MVDPLKRTTTFVEFVAGLTNRYMSTRWSFPRKEVPTTVRALVPKVTLVMAEALSDFHEMPTIMRRLAPVGATFDTVTLPLATLLVRVAT